jgi:hypothetical protein
MIFLLQSAIVCANEEYSDINSEDSYIDESYVEERYTEESQIEEHYSEETYPEEQYFNEEESSHQEPAYQEPGMDSYQANQVKEAQANCQQWAAESGLEDDDKTAFVEDCVYSQTGF